MGATRGRKEDVDALAAAVLLQHYLDAGAWPRASRRQPPAAQRSLLPLVIAAAATNAAPRAGESSRPAASFAAVTDSLVAHGVIAQPALVQAAGAGPGGGPVGARGSLRVRPRGSTPGGCSPCWPQGREASRRFTVPEGLTDPGRRGARLRSGWAFPSDAVLAAARDGAAATALLGFPVRSFEGFLRPETYVAAGSTLSAPELVRIMAEGFKADLEAGVDRAARHPPA